MKTLVYLGVFSTFSGAYAWGAVGHEAIGYIAMQFLSPKTLSFVQTSLGADYNESLGVAGPWADTVRSEAAYSWSAPFHFVDAEGCQDDPPTSCSVMENRDCPETCVLTAIANYTTRLIQTSLSDMQRQEALKFLDHFIGDITQPLHVEALELGGNDIDVTCNRSNTNLHAVNTGMIARLLGDNYSNSVITWANALVERIQTGTFNSAAVSSWISCSSTTTPATIQDDISTLLASENELESGAVIPLACPLAWAVDSNQFDCSYVFNFQTGTDLCTSGYYTGAVPIVRFLFESAKQDELMFSRLKLKLQRVVIVWRRG
ncbi:S1/P1 nuclease [Mycena metata]|uniref:S1/P1 nuclease n=1 Tax=Mycena metata TaxID=1033252 RepID=A0AAD7NWL1_9AGAR|nr:S1/P1 nuclease [Mycena metata]